MTEILSFLAPPLVMCLVLAGVHCYLGLHVLARGVVFVDLSLAQVATLGASLAALIGLEHHAWGSYLVTLVCTLLAAALFATLRRLEARVSQEALIGLVYAFASAAIVLVLDRTPHGMEELKESLVGSILWVTWSDVLKTAMIYSGVGLVHFLAREALIKSSFAKDGASWRVDFLFYGLFGVVITSSTHYAGVLLVFALLIVPALLGAYFFESMRARLAFGWVFGALFSFLGVAMSYWLDFPVGAFIVVLFTAVPLVLLGVLSLVTALRS